MTVQRFSRIIVAVSLFCPSVLQADLLTEGSPSLTFDFSGFTGAGFSPTPTAGQLNSDHIIVAGLSDGPLGFGGTETSGDFARGPSAGGVTTGGVYAFDLGGGNTALGIQLSGWCWAAPASVPACGDGVRRRRD